MPTTEHSQGSRAPSCRKVFGIGYHRTGTRTLGECFRLLGLRGTGFDFELTAGLLDDERIEPILTCARRYQAFRDWPWPLCFRELDKRFPGSCFVLTTRQSSETWFASLMNHYAWVLAEGPSRHPELFPLLYGARFPSNRSACIERYENHNREVRDYFAGTGRLLEVCWERGDGWDALCGLLGTPQPSAPFPHLSWFSSDRSVPTMTVGS